MTIKKVFVSMRSLLMEGESGWCQLLFAQRRKQRCPFPPCTPALPCEHCSGKAATQRQGERRRGCWRGLGTPLLRPLLRWFVTFSGWTVTYLMPARTCSKLLASMVLLLWGCRWPWSSGDGNMPFLAGLLGGDGLWQRG